MEGVDFLHEALKNSIEAQASHIAITVNEDAESMLFSVSDDGGGFAGDGQRFFREGVSEKGDGRGRGLSLLHLASGGVCRLERTDGITCLTYRLMKGPQLGLLSSIVPSLFGLIDRQQLSFSWKRGTEVLTLDDSDVRVKGEIVHTPAMAVGIRKKIEVWE